MKYDIIKSCKYLARDSSGALYGYGTEPTKVTYRNGESFWKISRTGFVIFILERNDALSFIKSSDDLPWTVHILEEEYDYGVLKLRNRSNIVTIEKFRDKIEVTEGTEVLDVVDEDDIEIQNETVVQKGHIWQIVKKFLSNFIILQKITKKK